MNISAFSSTPATILIIDDDQAIAYLLAELLSDEGYHIHLTRTLAEARHFIASGEPDVALLDVHLPDGNGLDLCAELHANPQTADLPILLLSAIDRSSQAVARGLNLGGYDFLPKPFSNDELIARVRVLVRLRELQQRIISQERDRAMLATAGAATHKLGQPLTAALGLVDLLLRTELAPTQREDVQMIDAALQQMADIVRQMQTVQRYATQPYLDATDQIEILDLEQAAVPEPGF